MAQKSGPFFITCFEVISDLIKFLFSSPIISWLKAVKVTNLSQFTFLQNITWYYSREVHTLNCYNTKELNPRSIIKCKHSTPFKISEKGTKQIASKNTEHVQTYYFHWTLCWAVAECLHWWSDFRNKWLHFSGCPQSLIQDIH